MCNKEIIPIILKVKNYDNKAFMQIYEVFKGLIIYFNRKMCCEDGASELTLFLLELLHRMDLSMFEDDESFGIHKYIVVALRNRFIDVSKKGRRDIHKTLPFIDVGYYTDEYRDEKIMLSDALKKLNKKQRRVIDYEFFKGYSEIEIAKLTGNSRQAVNSIKLRAFNTMKNFYK